MRERVLAIVTLITRYFLESEEVAVSEQEIVADLLQSGFAPEEIDAAFCWLEEQSTPTLAPPPITLTQPAQRVFTIEECLLLPLEARGFLGRLLGLGILDHEMIEEIIDSALSAAREGEVALRDIRQLAAHILHSRSPRPCDRELVCIMDDDWQALYH